MSKKLIKTFRSLKEQLTPIAGIGIGGSGTAAPENRMAGKLKIFGYKQVMITSTVGTNETDTHNYEN